MKTKRKTAWIAALAGFTGLAGTLVYTTPKLPPDLASAPETARVSKDTKIEDLDSSMRKQFPPGTPWAEVQRWMLENKVEHSPLAKAGKEEKKGWFQSHALFKDAGMDSAKRVHVAMDLSFDEHSNLRALELRRTYSITQ